MRFDPDEEGKNADGSGPSTSGASAPTANDRPKRPMFGDFGRRESTTPPTPPIERIPELEKETRQESAVPVPQTTQPFNNQRPKIRNNLRTKRNFDRTIQWRRSYGMHIFENFLITALSSNALSWNLKKKVLTIWNETLPGVEIDVETFENNQKAFKIRTPRAAIYRSFNLPVIPGEKITFEKWDTRRDANSEIRMIKKTLDKLVVGVGLITGLKVNEILSNESTWTLPKKESPNRNTDDGSLPAKPKKDSRKSLTRQKAKVPEESAPEDSHTEKYGLEETTSIHTALKDLAAEKSGPAESKFNETASLDSYTEKSGLGETTSTETARAEMVTEEPGLKSAAPKSRTAVRGAQTREKSTGAREKAMKKEVTKRADVQNRGIAMAEKSSRVSAKLNPSTISSDNVDATAHDKETIKRGRSSIGKSSLTQATVSSAQRVSERRSIGSKTTELKTPKPWKP